MSVKQVQLRLSIDGQQALSALDALELKQQDLISSNKELSESRTKDMDSLKNNLVEINKLQEKQALIEKQMASASEKGKFVELTKLEGIYEANIEKINELVTANTNYTESIHQNDLAIAESNKAIRSQRKEIEALYLADGDVLRSEAALVKEKRALTREASLAANGSERQAKAETRLAEVNKELTNRIRDRAKATVAATQKIIEEQGIEKVSTDDLITLNKALETANRHRTDRTTEDAKKEIESIKQVNKELAKRKEETKPDEEGGFLSKFKNGLPSAVIGGAAGAFAGAMMSVIPGIASAIGEAFSGAIERIKTKALQITAIQTSLDVTRYKAKEINDDLNKIDTKTSVAELNKLVEVAGDLNIATSGVKAFVTQADQIGIVMEKDFGSAEEAVTMIAKLKDEFRETKELQTDVALQKIGSSLKDLNLAGPATTQGITDFLKRTGALPDALKPAVTELMGFAAVFEEANLTAEIASSGFTKIISESANNVGIVAKQLKISKEEVEKLINTNPSEFVLKLASSLKGLSGTQVSQTLKNLKLDSDEVKKVMGVLSDNIDKVREKQDLASKSFQEASTIQRIFTDINADEAAKIERISKSWDSLKNSMSSWVALMVGPVINSLAGMTSKAKDLTLAYRNQEAQTKSLISTVTPLREQYEKLKDDAKKGADNHRELNKVIGEIGKVVPEAITQQDNYGNALSINIGLLDEYIKKQKQAQEQMKYRLKEDYTDRNNALAGERASILQKMREKEVVTNIDKRSGAVSTRKVTHEEMLKDQKRLQEINKEIQDNWNSKRNLDKEQAVTPTKTDTPDLKAGKKELTDEEKAKAKAKADKARQLQIAEDKYIQERNKQRIELQSKLAFEEKLAIANDEQKKVIQLERKAELELEQVRTQFKDKSGLVIAFAKVSKEDQDLINREEILIQKKLGDEKLKLQQEYQKKQDDAYEQHANKTIQIAQEQSKLELDRNLQRAKNSGKPLAIFNAEERIINNDQATETYAEKVKYLKEQQDAKGNKDALELIEKNHVAALELIQAKYQAKRDQHIVDSNEKERANAERNKLNSLGLDVKEAEAKGKNPLEQKLALLKAQEDAEVAAAEKTGQSVADIHRKFSLERQALETENWRTQAEKAIGHFQTAFNAIASIFSASIRNRTAEEQSSYDNSINNLDRQKEHGILTDRQYNKQKKALDKQHDTEQRKLKREQWELDKAATLSNIVMQTALAVMKASPNVPLQVATGVLGGIEFGIAASEKAPAYATGGFVGDARPSVRKPSKSAIQIWANEEGQEYMTPAWQLADPVAANLVGILEHRRQNKITGYVEGGPIGDEKLSLPKLSPKSGASSDALLLQFLGKNLKMMEIVTDNIQNIQAYINWNEVDTYELSKKQTKMNKKLDDSYSNTNQSLIN